MNDPTRRIRSGQLWLASVVVLASAQCVSQTSEVPQPRSVDGDGISKDFKLRGPLGVFQLPRRSVKVSRQIRRLLPAGAKVRLLQKLTLSPTDSLIVYEASDPLKQNPLMEIRYPAGLVLREGQIVGQFSLRSHSRDDPDWVFLEAGEIRFSPERSGIALAFRSMGDGSASLFLVIAREGKQYRTVLKKIAGQGRLRADREANLELWDAHEGNECVWCDHYYIVLSYRWTGSSLAPIRKTKTCRELDPDAMTDKPLESLNRSFEGEYAELTPWRKRVATRSGCDFRDPTKALKGREKMKSSAM